MNNIIILFFFQLTKQHLHSDTTKNDIKKYNTRRSHIIDAGPMSYRHDLGFPNHMWSSHHLFRRLELNQESQRATLSFLNTIMLHAVTSWRKKLFNSSKGLSSSAIGNMKRHRINRFNFNILKFYLLFFKHCTEQATEKIKR